MLIFICIKGKLIEWKENGTLVNMDDYVDRSKPELLSKYFRRHYSPSAFGTIFDFATKAIDVTQSARRNDLIDDYFKCLSSDSAHLRLADGLFRRLQQLRGTCILSYGLVGESGRSAG